MTITKTIMIFATTGFLAACDTGTGGMTTSGGGGMATGTNDISLVHDSRVAGKIESASMNGSTVIYTYYTDVIPNDLAVLEAADVYCPGFANPPTITEASVGGRPLKTFAFTCR